MMHVIQWKHKQGDPLDTGRWTNLVQGVFDSKEEAEGHLEWLMDECPTLYESFDHQIKAL
jgi:hypothetical protein